MHHEPPPVSDDASPPAVHPDTSGLTGTDQDFTDLVARYAPSIYGRCRHALGAADADDATQAVFLVLARKRAQAAASPALAAWLNTVADFVIRNARRERQRRRFVAASDSLAATPAPEPDMEDIKDHLDACLAALPTAEQQAIRLHHLAGHTLAEVAAHTGAPLSTVHDRIARGVQRLRALLAKRGVKSASLVAVLACLQVEATAAVPPELMGRLRDLAPADGPAGTTAAVSARVLRWSQPRMSTMSRLAISASVLLLAGAGAAFVTHSSAETVATGSATPTPPPKPAPGAIPPEFDFDPQHAAAWFTLRWNDGARTASRLATLPESALLGDRAAEVLATIAGVNQAALVLRPEVVFSREQMVAQYTLQHDLLRLDPQQQIQRMTREVDQQTAQAMQRAATDPSIAAGPLTAFLAGADGWIGFASPTAQHSFTALLTGPAAASLDCVLSGDGWTLAGGSAQLAAVGDRLALRGRIPPAAAQVATREQPTDPQADLEFATWFDRGLPGTAPLRTNRATCTVTADGLRLASSMPWANPQQGRNAAAWPKLDRARLAAIPAAAVLACAVQLTPTQTRDSLGLQAMLHSLTKVATGDGKAHDGDGDGVSVRIGAVPAPGSATVGPMTATVDASKDPAPVVALMTALTEAVRRIDGTVVLWVEPGAPLPTVTLEADLPQAAAEALLAATTLPRAADGTLSTLIGMAQLTIGWQSGRLICTTVPGGPAAIDRRGGFSDTPEVRRALAAMPDANPNLCVLLRPTALVDCIAPFVAMAGGDSGERLAAYRRKLLQNSAYAYCTLAGDERGMRLEASGLLSLVAAGVLGSAMQSLPHLAN